MTRTSTIVLGATYDEYDIKKYRESGRRFDVDLLPDDLRRVYGRLEEMFDEEYALTVVFTIRTAIELHRAWQVSLLTSNILQQIKDKFKLRMTWNLGVIDLVFRMEDGLYELHRRVPYDYDSEYQNMYFKTAVALVEGEIGIHDALIFQREIKQGKHTSPGGLLFRNNPGRLLLYPFQAATCCIIFFSGDLRDAGIAAICGLVAGLIELAMSSKRVVQNPSEAKILIDCVIGISTGVITGVFYSYLSTEDEEVCLRSVFLGTLYWFFYGTAFVIGLLEIIASELQTGVTRFLAVAVKTFVLSLSSAAGLTFVLGENVYEVWTEQLQPENGACDNLGLGGKSPWDPWWKIVIYILCSVSVLGQYRFILMNYWAALIVQVAAYVTQESVKYELGDNFEYDGMDTVFGDAAGAMASVITACCIAVIVDFVRYKSRCEISHEGSAFSKCMQQIYKFLVDMGNCLKIGRGLRKRSEEARQALEKESKALNKEPSEIMLSPEHEATLIEDKVEAQEYNFWSLLMPAVYQLVPGSKLAMYWYDVIFPPQKFQDPVSSFLNETESLNEILDGEGTRPPQSQVVAESAGYALWLTSLSLALGLMLGLAMVRILASAIVFAVSTYRKCMRRSGLDKDDRMDSFNLRRFGRQQMTHQDKDYDPEDVVLSSVRSLRTVGGVRNRKNQTPATTNENSPRSEGSDELNV